MPRRLSDADWMQRLIGRAGSQRKAAEQLGVSPSMVGRVARGERGGGRYREEAKKGARGRRVTPPAPTPKTPRRVRQPVRQTVERGSRVTVARSARLFGREVERSQELGRALSGVVVSGTFARSYRNRGGAWSGSLAISTPTDEQIEMLMAGNTEGVLEALREVYSWVGGGRIHSMTYTDR